MVVVCVWWSVARVRARTSSPTKNEAGKLNVTSVFGPTLHYNPPILSDAANGSMTFLQKLRKSESTAIGVSVQMPSLPAPAVGSDLWVAHASFESALRARYLKMHSKGSLL